MVLPSGARWPTPVARRKGPAEEGDVERLGEESVPGCPNISGHVVFSVGRTSLIRSLDSHAGYDPRMRQADLPPRLDIDFAAVRKDA